MAPIPLQHIPCGRSPSAAPRSPFREVERSPALFLEFLPACNVGSRRTLLIGRTVEAVIARSEAEFGCAFEGQRGFEAIDGDCDGVVDVTPLFGMPEGTERLTLFTPFGWATTGAIVMVEIQTAPGRRCSPCALNREEVTVVRKRASNRVLEQINS